MTIIMNKLPEVVDDTKVDKDRKEQPGHKVMVAGRIWQRLKTTREHINTGSWWLLSKKIKWRKEQIRIDSEKQKALNSREHQREAKNAKLNLKSKSSMCQQNNFRPLIPLSGAKRKLSLIPYILAHLSGGGSGSDRSGWRQTQGLLFGPSWYQTLSSLMGFFFLSLYSACYNLLLLTEPNTVSWYMKKKESNIYWPKPLICF